MRTRSFATMLAGTTALCLPLMATPSAAQTGPCDRLLAMVEEAGADLPPELQDASRAAQANDIEQCTLIVSEIDKARGASGSQAASATDDADDSASRTETASDTETETRDFSASDTVTSTVEVEQQAVVEGEVIVGLPDPEVAVEQPGAEVTVRESRPSLRVDERPAEIVVRQRQASITVDMPRPTITIEQPAPEIVVTMPRPGVSLDQGRPQVEVMMADPRVTVSQADPTLDVQVDARFVDPDSEEAMNTPEDGVVARTERLNAQGTGTSDEQASVRISKGQATVRVEEGEGETEVSYNRAEPNVRFESADPEISFSSQGEPRVEIRRMGEPKVTFRQDDAEGQQQQGQNDSQTRNREQDQASLTTREPSGDRTPLNATDRNRMLGRADTSGMDFQPTPLRVADLVGKDVITTGGDEVGEISRVVTNNNLVFAVIEHGGFLGIGEDEVALPLRRIAVRGDEAVLLGLTEDELEKMPDYDPSQNRMMRDQDQLEVRMVDG